MNNQTGRILGKATNLALVCGLMLLFPLANAVAQPGGGPPPPPPPGGGAPPSPSAPNNFDHAARELNRAYEELGRLAAANGASEQASALLARGRALYNQAYASYDAQSYYAAGEYARAASDAAHAGRQLLTAGQNNAFGPTDPTLRTPPVAAGPVPSSYEATNELQRAANRIAQAQNWINQFGATNLSGDLNVAQALYQNAQSLAQSGNYAGAIGVARSVHAVTGIIEHVLRAQGFYPVATPPAPGAPPPGGGAPPPAPGAPVASDHSARELVRAYEELGRIFASGAGNSGTSASLFARGRALYNQAYASYDAQSYYAAGEYARAASDAAHAARHAFTAANGAAPTAGDPTLRTPPIVSSPSAPTVYDANRELQHAANRISQIQSWINQFGASSVQSDLAVAVSLYEIAYARAQAGDYKAAMDWARAAAKAAGVADHLLRALGYILQPTGPGGAPPPSGYPPAAPPPPSALSDNSTSGAPKPDGSANAASASGESIKDSSGFVRRQYLDFLNREPEAEGFKAWVEILNNCAGSPKCDRIEVSASFFQSEEFQLKGFYVYRYYTTSFGRRPYFVEFLRDLAQVTGSTGDEVTAMKAAFAENWVERDDFKNRYDRLSNTAFVNELLQASGVSLSDTESLVRSLDAGEISRAGVLRAVVESTEVYNREYNAAFVAMQYFGYLRRDAEEQGFNDWLRAINSNAQDYRTMIHGFVNSTEYQNRFNQ